MSPLFNRNKKTTIAELEEYYANQRTSDSSARAWAMAVLSLLITVAIILALFFAGRWLWRVISDDDSSTPATTTSQSAGVTVNADGTLSGDLSLLDNNSSNTQSGGSVSVDTGATSESNDNSSEAGVVSDEAASTDETNADTVSSSSSDSDVAGVNSSDDDSSAVTSSTDEDSSDSTTTPATELPNTGAGLVLLAPVIAGAAGYTASITRKRR